MSKKLVPVLIAVLIIASLVAGCANTGTGTTGGEKVKVFGAFATPIEEPWDGVIHQALNAAKDAGKIDYTYTENIGYSGDMERILREVADQQKPDIIMGDAFGNEEAVRRVAKDYPDIAFAFGSGLGPADPNFSVFDNWIQEPAYLAGMLAGGMSKSGIVGVVGGYPVPEVNRLVNAFIKGAKEVNPDVKVLVAFINSWFDPAAAKEAALAQVDGGADVLFAERFGVIDAAKEKGILAIGNMSDQNSLAPDTVITSPVWDMAPTVEYLVNQVNAGSYTAMDLKDFSMMAKGGASLAPFHSLESKIPADLLAKVTQKQADIKSGLFRVDVDEAQPAAVN
ncbi:MAG TPA: BMP family ABC transporter substrate-binding protein [Anaerolineaceae bacterium]|jgi:basic membrane lipoprotein Med (substrate-binding protein (PBP1-ABC) superfamily)|nr:BMP family ABC transporter substrate-binding protein [Anaerolineaceae bacterium]